MLNRACREIRGFSSLLQRLERNISILGRSQSTFKNYARHIASTALHFGCLPTDLDPEQVKDYLYELQQRSVMPSQSYFKHTVYGLRFLLRTEGLPYDYLALPSISKEKKLPVILSREEIWGMLQSADLLKHRLLIGLLYSCGLRCMEVRRIELKHLDFDRKLLHIVQSKGKKDRYVPLSDHIIRGLKTYISVEHPTTYLFTGNSFNQKDLNTGYSQRGVQWVIKSICKKAGIYKDVHTHTLRHSYATHLLEDGVNILLVQRLLGHSTIESTMVYLHVCQLENKKVHSPLDTVFELCRRNGK